MKRKKRKREKRKNKQFIYQINNVSLFFNLRASLFNNRVTIKTTNKAIENRASLNSAINKQLRIEKITICKQIYQLKDSFSSIHLM